MLSRKRAFQLVSGCHMLQVTITDPSLHDTIVEHLKTETRTEGGFTSFDSFPNGGASLVGRMALFKGLSDDTYNNQLLLITRIDYERTRIIVQHGTRLVQGHTLPSFATLPLSKLYSAHVVEGDGRLNGNKDVSDASNLLPALAASGFDWKRLVCVKYHPHPDIPIQGGQHLLSLADYIPGYTVCYGYYIYGNGYSEGKPDRRENFGSEKTPMLKDQDGNFIDLLPDIAPYTTPMIQRAFIEEPNSFALDKYSDFFKNTLSVDNSAFLHLTCFPFSAHIGFSNLVKEDHKEHVQLYENLPSLLPSHPYAIVDRRTIDALFASMHEVQDMAFLNLAAGTPSYKPSCTVALPSEDTFAVARLAGKCDCCGIHTHLDILTCSTRGAAAYCSKLCLKLHARQHKNVCKSAEWKAQQRVAALARKEQLARYEKRMREEDKARKEVDAALRKQVEADRLRRAAQLDPAYSARGPSHRGKEPMVKQSPTVEERAKRAVAKEEGLERQRQHQALLREKEEQRVRCGGSG